MHDANGRSTKIPRLHRLIKHHHFNSLPKQDLISATSKIRGHERLRSFHPEPLLRPSLAPGELDIARFFQRAVLAPNCTPRLCVLCVPIACRTCASSHLTCYPAAPSRRRPAASPSGPNSSPLLGSASRAQKTERVKLTRILYGTERSIY